MQEVSGSIPLSSTKLHPTSLVQTKNRGAIAQLGERLHGMQEVSGSIPLSSTKLHPTSLVQTKNRGAIAQLGERLHGMQEVSGSIPLSSTTFQTLASAGVFPSGFSALHPLTRCNFNYVIL